ncbi:MAG: hypothetical protein MUE90_03075 [Thermoanaerobaculales bacterium]|nr:hypothetical protein [Thermoanaerobaculales bacterium]
MDWLEQNIDAYRIVSEILGEMRRAVREGLEAVYGDRWYRDGLPESVFQRLVAAKERERSIDWYEGQYQQIMDYAVFADLIEILERNAEHFPTLMALAPSASLLQARFLELDVMRAKLGRARPVSETELSFLGTFHLRFRKAVAETVPPAPRPRSDDAAPPEAPTPQPPAPPKRAPEPARAAPRPPASPPRQGPSTEAPKRAVQSSAGSSRTSKAAGRSEDDEETTPGRRTKGGLRARPAVEDSGEHEAAPARSAGEDEEPQKFVGPRKLAEALEANDHRTVLRELYREVTAIAEGVWSSDVTPAPLVWEQVTASDWYETNFSKLGLHPLSVFYDVTGKVEKMARSGGTKKELQEFLKETNFAKTLLALRDMFQANNL